MSSDLDVRAGQAADDSDRADAPDPVPGDGAPDDGTEAGGSPPRHVVFRLRELSPSGRLAAAALGFVVALGPLLAFAHFGPGWVPAGDNALIGLRILDVFTSRTPTVGQPSTSGLYGGFESHAFHPGAIHFYLMYPFVKVLGMATGMTVVSILITAGSGLIATWAVFRQLGPRAGAVTAVVVGLIMFTTGASSLFNPISSNISGYPLLCSAVLVWALLCGDDRLLPLAVATISFAAEAHLSVGPAMVMLAVTALVGIVVRWWRTGVLRDRAGRRHVGRVVGVSAAVGAVLWAGPLVQEVRGDPGNFSALVRYVSDSDRPTVGSGHAVRQIARGLGLPPLLGRTQLSGGDIGAALPWYTWASAALAVAVLVVAAWRWRRREPRRSLLVVMVGVLAVCGFVNGSSVPKSIESDRLTFYHWIWALVLFTTLGLVLAVATVARPVVAAVRARAPRALPRLAVAAALLVVVVPAAINPGLERPSNLTNRVGHLYPRATFDQITDPVLERRDEIEEPITVMGVGGPLFDGTSEGVAVELADHGMDVVFGKPYRWYVHDDHLLDRNPPGAALVLFTREATDPEDAGDIFGGEVLDVIDVDGGFDREAFAELVDQARDAPPRAGDELEAYSAEQIPLKQLSIRMMLDDLVSEPESILVNRDWVRFLRDHPPESPRLDPELLDRVDASWPRSQDLLLALDVEVRLVQGEDLSEVLSFGRVINPPLD